MNDRQKKLLDELLNIINNPEHDLSADHDGCMGNTHMTDTNGIIVDIIKFVESENCIRLLKED
jgi:hypothetical protein